MILLRKLWNQCVIGKQQKKDESISQYIIVSIFPLRSQSGMHSQTRKIYAEKRHGRLVTIAADSGIHVTLKFRETMYHMDEF